jgi:ribonuclease R/exosome complex exonuclease DIS3/RRP44
MKEEKIKINDILGGRLSVNASGSAYLTDPNLPKDIYIHKSNTNHGLHLDKVNIRVKEGVGRAMEGEVIEIVERFRTEFVGTLQISPKFAFFVPDSNKLPIDFFIPLSALNKAQDGQKVVVKLTEWKDEAKNPNGEVIRVLGDAGEHETEIHSILEEYGLPYDFDEDVLAEARTIPIEITQAEIDNRRDMRDVLTFTIDPADAKDFDDALSVEWVDGELFVGIHIADVSHYLRPETELDKEAFARGTSVYLVDRCVPMLPENLSNGLCSLRPNEDKLCFSAVFKLDHNGHVLEEWFGRTVINSDHRFTYEEAQEMIEWKNYNTVSSLFKKIGLVDFSVDEKVDEDLVKATNLTNAIIHLDKLAKKIRKIRLSKGSISFDKQEVKFKLDENNKPVGIHFKVAKDSNKLIEEFMLLANRHVAQYINKRELPNVNRAHDKPNEDKLANLKDFISQFGYEIRIDTPEETTRTLNQLLIDVKGTAEEDMINNLVVRTMQKANYTTKNIGHYGLGFKDYSHFTSPIRRYPDVITHRLLGLYLENKPTLPKIEKLEAKCQHLSEREKKAQKAERDSIKYMQCVYMSDNVGKIFEGIVSSVTDYGLFVEILENKCDGFIKLSDINGDTYQTDVNNHCVKGYNTSHKIRLGDVVHVIVSSVDIEKKNINLSLINL